MQKLLQSSSETNRFFKIRRTLLHFVVLLGALLSVLVFLVACRYEKLSIEDRAITIAAMVDQDALKQLTGTPSDIETIAYKKLDSAIHRVSEANSDIYFVYLYGVRDGNAFFYVDSEPEGSPNFSPPGQIYQEATEEFKGVIETGLPMIEGPVKDRWGTWVSGLAPVIDQDTGEVIAAVGIDISAFWFYSNVAAHTVIPILLTIIALMIVYGGQKIRERRA